MKLSKLTSRPGLQGDESSIREEESGILVVIKGDREKRSRFNASANNSRRRHYAFRSSVRPLSAVRLLTPILRVIFTCWRNLSQIFATLMGTGNLLFTTQAKPRFSLRVMHSILPHKLMTFSLIVNIHAALLN